MRIKATDYQAWINKFIECNDTREINFQNDVIKKLLEKIFIEYDIVYADVKGPDTDKHDYYAYSGKYIDKNGKVKPTTPDLLICKNWNWYNKDDENIQYIATVEVKSPFGGDAIYKKKHVEYSDKWKNKIETHLDANKINKVIFTDCFKWEFYTGSYDEYETIELVNRVKVGRGYTYEWCDDIENKFSELIKKLREFLFI